MEALWRGKRLLDLIRRQKGGVMLPLGVLSDVAPCCAAGVLWGLGEAFVREC